MWKSLGFSERFQYLNFEKGFWKSKTYLKNWSTVFYFKVLQMKEQHFHAKLLYQKPMLRQIECGIQNGSITKNGLLPLTALLFWKFDLSLWTSYKYCFKVPVAEIYIFILFVRALALFEDVFSQWVSVKNLT